MSSGARKSILVATLLSAVGCSHSHGGAADALYCSLQVAGIQECYGYAKLSAAEKSAESDACTAALGTIVGACPAGYVGCCESTISGYTLNQCYYAGTASELHAACIGTWTGPSGGEPDGGGNPNPDGGVGSCTGTQSLCPKGCADLDHDVNNCGSCGYACPPGPSGSTTSCSAGTCSYACAAPSTLCDLPGGTSCANLQTSPTSCGSCNNNCSEMYPPECRQETGGCESGVCATTADPQKDGTLCTGGLCASGVCHVALATCSFNGANYYFYQNGTSVLASECTCTGNTLEYGTGSLACPLCITNGSLGTADCLQ